MLIWRLWRKFYWKGVCQLNFILITVFKKFRSNGEFAGSFLSYDETMIFYSNDVSQENSTQIAFAKEIVFKLQFRRKFHSNEVCQRKFLSNDICRWNFPQTKFYPEYSTLITTLSRKWHLSIKEKWAETVQNNFLVKQKI